MSDKALQLVLGSVFLLLIASLLTWFFWGRRPKAQPEPTPEPDVDTLSDAPTMAHNYPKIPHPDEMRVADDVPPARPAWQPPVHPTRLRRWDRQRTGGEVWSEDCG